MFREARRQQAANKAQRYSVQKLPPLSPNEFRECCEHGYKAALRLAAFSSGLAVAKLEDMYQHYCDGGVEFDWQSLQAHPAEAEDDDMGMMEEAGATTNGNECKNLLRSIQEDGATSADLSVPLQDGHAKDFDLEEVLLESVPDASSIIEVAAASAANESAPKESSTTTSKYVTLRNAFTAVDNGKSVWDSLWRLAMYLRHGRHVVVYGKIYTLSSLYLSFFAL